MLASPIFYEERCVIHKDPVVEIPRSSLSFPMSSSNSPGQEINEISGFPPAVFSTEGPGVVVPGPPQFPPSNFVLRPEPSPYYYPPQGPPTYSPYQDNSIPLQVPNGFTWQAPQNVTAFGTFPAGQYPYIEQQTSYVNPAFVAPVEHGFSTQPQFHHPGPVAQYPAPVNATGPVDAVAVTYDEPWHNGDDPDEDQSRGKRL